MDEVSIIQEVAGDVAASLSSLPEPIQRNLITAACTLITGLVDVPASYLELKAAEFRIKRRGHEQVMLAAARGAAIMANKSPELAGRAIQYFASELINEQANREAVAREAINSISSLPQHKSSVETPPIDPDWINQFRKLAASKSRPEIQAIWGRILAGEVCQPNSFSPFTLEVVARLDQATAQSFELVANHAFIVSGRMDFIVTNIVSDDNKLEDVANLNWHLINLQTYGLVTGIETSFLDPKMFLNLPESTLGGRSVTARVTEVESQSPRLPRIYGSVAYLTQAGGELQAIISKSFNLAYAERLQNGLKRMGVELEFPENSGSDS